MFGQLTARAKVTAAATLLALAGLGLALVAAPSAQADPPQTMPTPVSAAALPTWQINGVAWSQAIVGNTVYVGGSFTRARPPGVPVGGAGEVDAANIFAYDVTTGQRVATFAHSLNGQALVVRASADGSRVYVGGDFSTVDGVPHGHLVAFNTSDGSLINNWNPNVGGQVRALGITADTVYVGGNFPSANGLARKNLAAFSTATGKMTDWAPTAEGTAGYVWSMVMAPDASRVIVGGSFATLNQQSAYGMGSLDAQTGATLPWAANQRIRTAGANGAITSLKSDGAQIFGSGYAFGSGASFEGTFAADPSTGSINWVNDCLGDTYDTFPMDRVLYAVSHSHNCSAINEFPDTSPRSRWQKATAAPTFANGVITQKDAYGWDYRGLPYAGLLQWYPDLDFGSYTPDRQAAWSVTGNGTYLALAGEFPTVNGVAQQGLVRFAYRGVAGTSQKPLYSAAMTPVATSTEAGSVRISWQTTWDRDDRTLTYDVYRDNGPSIGTVKQDSVFWNLPRMGFQDNGVGPGEVHTYKVRAKDSDGNVQWSVASNAVTVSNTPAPAYLQLLRADGASHVWRLGDVGPVALDSAQFSDLNSSSVSFGKSGSQNSDAAITTTSSSKLSTSTVEPHPGAATVEAWIKTTSSRGGRIAGFGDAGLAGTSAQNDLVLYLANSGRVNFAAGANSGAFAGVQSARAVNDGQWHHVVGSAGPNGIALYVDGRLVGRDTTPAQMQAFPGYWRLGSDQTSGLPNRPTDAGLAGSLDEVAVYPGTLSQSAVQGHYLASGRSANWATAAPSDAYSAAVLANAPDQYWRLNERSGYTAADSSPTGVDGTTNSGVSFGYAGAIAGDNAASFNGSTGLVVSRESRTDPTGFATELWFSTTTTRGGKLIGFGNASSGTSSSYDRQVCLLNNGRLEFGVDDGAQEKATSPASYNDGKWHHLVAGQGADGMKLYVDSVLVATNPATTAADYVGYWRVGGDKCWGGTSSNFVSAKIDEVAVYPGPLNQAAVDAHYAASGRTLPNKPPVAAFSHNERYLGASFDASASSDPDGTVSSYSWNFGDGATGSGSTASHSYAAPGTYPVTLTVTDNGGLTATVTNSVTVVANVAPTAAFTSTSSYLSATFDGSGSTDPDGSVASYAWDFGDGGTATGASASHTFAGSGTYTVTLRATDDQGAVGTTSRAVAVVANVPPTAAFASSVAGSVVSLDASASSDTDGTVAAYGWDFGDGSTGTGRSTSHSYAADGTYQVTLTVTDNAGATNATSAAVTITAPVNQPPVASFSTAVSLQTVAVDGSASSDPDGTVTGYAWDFGDGATGTGATASHRYASAGTYLVTLTVTDDRGATASATKQVTAVADQPPVAVFTHTETFLNVSLDASGSHDAEGPIAGYSWNFGDGSIGAGVTAAHTYPAAGSYLVTLTVTDGAGATATSTATVVVAANPAFATDDFGRTVASGWGTAPLGGAWALSGAASKYSVSGGTGNVSLGAGGSATMTLPGVSSNATEVTTVLSTDKAATGGGIYVSVIGRQISAGNDYRAKVRLLTGGGVSLALAKTEAGTETVLSTVTVPGLTYAAGDRLQVRLQVSGTSPTSMSAKVWKDGTTEPAQWAIAFSDSSATLQSAGSVGLYAYVSGSSTAVPVGFKFDDWWSGPLRP